MYRGSQVRRRIWLAILALACTGIWIPAAVAQALERMAEDKSLHIGFIADQPPFSAKSAAGAPEGYAIDLCAIVAQTIGQRVGGLATAYTEVTVDNGLRAIADGRIDLLCGAVTATLQRRETVDFSQPIFITGTSALLRKHGPRILRDLAFADGPPGVTRSIELTPFETIRVGVHSGTRTEALLTEAIAKGGYSATMVGFPSHGEGLAALQAGSINAYFADRGLLTAMLENKPDSRLELGTRVFSREPYAIGMRRGDSALRLLVDRALTSFFQSPQLRPLLARYFGDQADMILAQLREMSLPE
jgi:ABC-type amino acid transport substrate-binding protein